MTVGRSATDDGVRFPRWAEITTIAVAGALLYLAFGYWRFSWIGPPGVFTTADELYLFEWLLAAGSGTFRSTLPYGFVFHAVLHGWMSLLGHIVPSAMSIAGFTSAMRLAGALIWLAFGAYCLCLGGIRRVWLAILLGNPVVIFMAFGNAKPDFLTFVLSVLAFLHWIRFCCGSRAADVYAAGAFLGAALATKISAALPIPLYPVVFWSLRSHRTTASRLHLALAILATVIVTFTLSPEYRDIPRTIEALRSEFAITGHGFPGAPLYPAWYWLVALMFSFPAEIALSICDALGEWSPRRVILMAWTVSFAIFAWFVHRLMPAYLLPLMAVPAALGLDGRFGRSPFPHRAVTISLVTAALLFSAICLYPKLVLDIEFVSATSYGHAATFIRLSRITPRPLSEISISNDAELPTAAHLWTPEVLASVLAEFQSSPPGYYLLARDSYIKSTVNPYLLADLGPMYANAVTSFIQRYPDHLVFSESHDLDADKRFYEIHTMSYWPWRYILALARAEPVAPGCTISVYRF